jgi:outer membrane protein OmpA-like peptidoglycan-associated protein
VRSTGYQLGMRAAVALGFGALVLGGCAGMTHTQQGAVVGGAIGAAAGAGVSAATGGSTTRGAIVGAVVGGAAGALIGREMDRQAREIERVEGAEVERVGEGIHVTFASGLLFPFDSDQLMPAARENLRQFAQTLRENTDTQVLIVGHTDSVGTMAYNQGLSERRALATSQYLQSQGVAASRLNIAGRGETEPRYSNETEAGRQQNRRVEIAIYASEAWRNRVQSEVGTE